MDTKIMFDTLHYANLLKNSGVQKAEAQADALSHALCHNIYTKDEVDMRFEQALKRFDERTLQMKDEMRAEFNNFMRDNQQQHHKLELENKDTQNDFNLKLSQSIDKSVQRFTIQVGIIMTFFTIINSVMHYLT